VKIKDRIALQFTLMVAVILMLFSIAIYSISANYRQEEFFDRLKSKARTTCRLLVNVHGIDKELLRVIDQNTLTEMLDEKVLIFNSKNELIYSSVDNKLISYDAHLLTKIRREKDIEFVQNKNETIGLFYEEGEEELVVLASAFDTYGQSKMDNLRETLSWGLVAGIGLTIMLGIYFAGNSLQPINLINQQVSLITAQNLHEKLDEGNRKDEIAQLAINFNTVLTRLNKAFEQQKSFVSHASHELRTPLAALKLEVQFGQRITKDNPELKEIFDNLFSDTEHLISITNNLLFLARSVENMGEVNSTQVRIEDISFLAKEELLHANPNYQINIDYDHIPEDENHTIIQGNEELLTRLLLNLLDNACKYSPDHTANLYISTNKTHCMVRIIDHGIGIGEEDLKFLFDPFYRSYHSKEIPGFGIGLSICQRIVELHRGTITVSSVPDQGSTFTVALAHVGA
jgi:signal transduction histidine kinase